MPTILAIDDKQDNLIVFTSLLKNLLPHCSVVTARSGAEGIEKAMTALPDVILLDITMPGMDGFETCRRIKSDDRIRHIPVIMITAIRTDSHSRVRGLELGADIFISKPIDEHELVSQLSVALRIKGAEDDLRKQKADLERLIMERTKELHLSEERLHRAEKMEALGKLAGGVAHDLNNVLGVLSGYAELLLEKIPEGNPTRRYAEHILSSSIKGAAIIDDMLVMARRGVPVAKVINLNSVVSGFLSTPAFEKLQADHPSVTFTAYLDRELLNITASPVHVEKTMMNLIINAAEAVKGNGRVTIRTENRHLDKAQRGYEEIKAGVYAVLTVSDSGKGIAASDIDNIFEPFYTKRTMGMSGTGLGLAVVWGMVKDHNGYIDVKSVEGEGSIFALFFPVSRESVGE